MRYFKDNSGQFAIMFCVGAMMLLFAVGVAVDIAGVTKEKQRLQNMTDSAVLAAAGSGEDKVGVIKEIAAQSIDQNNARGWTLDVKTTLVNDVVRVEAKTSYNAFLMGVLGAGDIPVSAASEAPLPKEVPVNIALVLDSTGSMSGANMDALKSASKVLLDSFAGLNPGTIQAAVVPYAQYVNVGLANRSAPWIDVEDDSSTTLDEVCYMTKDTVDSSLCTTTSTPSTCYNDSGSYSCTSSSTTCPPEAYGPEYEYCYTPTSTQTWNGCVGSRTDPFHTDPDYKGNKIPGIMNTSCGTEALELSSDMVAVQARIDSLTATGNTYIPAGLIWGWRMLDPDQPFGNLTNSQTDRKRALVLMTDGANTVRLATPYHYSDTQMTERAAADALTLELCQGIKDEGIDLYSVAYKLESADAATTQMVKDCATSSATFFQADNAAELEKAFKDIALSLYEVRLSK